MEKEKSLNELRAAIDEESLNAGTQEEPGKSENEDASSNDEGTSQEASKDDQNEGTSEEEWVVPGRFRTQADVLKAYQELESFTGRQSSEIQKLRTAIVEPPRHGESENEKNTRLRRFAEELTQDPERAIEERIRRVVGEVKQDVQASEFQRAYTERIKDPEFAELDPIMANIAQYYGDMIIQNNMQNDPRLLDILHLAARGVKAAELASKAKSAGIKAGEAKAKAKGKARIEGASGTTKTKKQDISKLSASEMKAAILKGDIDISE